MWQCWKDLQQAQKVEIIGISGWYKVAKRLKHNLQLSLNPCLFKHGNPNIASIHTHFYFLIFQDEQKQEARKKNLLILILQYLNDEGWVFSGFELV